jgi:outer membrane protein OmpA-like peptidoglycan-associated protein
MVFTPFLRAQVAQRLPTPVNFRSRQALEIEGFSEFSTEVTPEQLRKIEDLAVEIIKSNETRDPIFEFRVEGHADIARREPERTRAQFERDISQDRAQVGFDLLVDALKRRGSDALAQKIAKGSRAFGLGSTQLKLPRASSEAEFRRNRRVVFIVRQVTFLPPPPEPPPPPTSVVEDRFSVQLIRAATLSGNPAKGIEVLLLKVTLEVVDRIDKKKARFDVTAFGGGFGGGPTPASGSITSTPGPVVNFKTFRLLGARGGIINLQSFEGKVTVFSGIGGGAGPAAKGGTLSFSFDALEEAGANTQPTIITVPGGDSAVVPGISLGDVTVGRMSMQGTPSDN